MRAEMRTPEVDKLPNQGKGSCPDVSYSWQRILGVWHRHQAYVFSDENPKSKRRCVCFWGYLARATAGIDCMVAALYDQSE